MLGAGLALVLVAASCGDSDSLLGTATAETALDVFIVYPLSGDPTLPAAIDLAGRRAVRPAILGGRVLNFDLAFDHDTQGRIRILPAAQVATPVSGVPRTGLQVVGTAFDALNRAPSGGYRYDSTVVVSVGETVAIQAAAATCSATYPLYAKLRIDSVGTTPGRPLWVRVRSDPNCGFRSLDPGVPKN